jgi:hypothetical protein
MTTKKKKKKASTEPAKPPELAHDDREIDYRAIGRFGVILAIATGVVMAGMWSLTKMFTRDAVAGAPEPAPMATDLPSSPPDPKLQPEPRAGLHALREAERADLEGYGWVDQNKRIVRIPIARAIDILAERGLPTRQMGPPMSSPVAVPNDGSLEPPKSQGGAR